jgi:hypothetical protein
MIASSRDRHACWKIVAPSPAVCAHSTMPMRRFHRRTHVRVPVARFVFLRPRRHDHGKHCDDGRAGNS